MSWIENNRLIGNLRVINDLQKSGLSDSTIVQMARDLDINWSLEDVRAAGFVSRSESLSSKSFPKKKAKLVVKAKKSTKESCEF